MTPKQILDSFSETLMRDERILSGPERGLVATLLQHAKAATAGNAATEEAVRAVIASAVGETVAQRAFAVLGGSIVERILESSALPRAETAGARNPDIYASPLVPPPKEPQPPGKPLPAPVEPQPPSTSPAIRAAHTPIYASPLVPPPKEPQPPGTPLPAPVEPQPPRPAPSVRYDPLVPPPKEPQPPRAVHTGTALETRSALAERPSVLPARCVVLDEFLAPQELEELTRFTLDHQASFSASEVISPSAESGVVNFEHRRSLVLTELAQYQNLILERIKSVLPKVLDRLDMEEFSISGVEAQITASNDGDFFHFHSDNGSDRVASRYLTFVYFFHREPRGFEGGELRIHDAHLEDGVYVSAGSYQTIVPQQNQIVLFPCEMLHEITAVNCGTQLFADSRFTLNGWLRR